MSDDLVERLRASKVYWGPRQWSTVNEAADRIEAQDRELGMWAHQCQMNVDYASNLETALREIVKFETTREITRDYARRALEGKT